MDCLWHTGELHVCQYGCVCGDPWGVQGCRPWIFLNTFESPIDSVHPPTRHRDAARDLAHAFLTALPSLLAALP